MRRAANIACFLVALACLLLVSFSFVYLLACPEARQPPVAVQRGPTISPAALSR